MAKPNRIRSTAPSQVISWLVKRYKLPFSGETYVEDLLQQGSDGFPYGMNEAYFIADRFPVKQNIIALTPSSKLVRLAIDAYRENDGDEDTIWFIISDSTTSGLDNSLFLVCCGFYEDPEDVPGISAIRDWYEESMTAPNIITGGCFIKKKDTPTKLVVQALQLSTYNSKYR